MPFIPVAGGQQTTTPDMMYGGLGLTTLVLKPIDIQIINGQPTPVSLTTDSDIYFNSVPNTPNTFTAALSNLDSVPSSAR